ncbi:MAG: ATP-binding protein [Bacteroidales bacterium]|nr:ATP-binding protein [Bacteroidales bacterium]MDY0217005.1 ATP-binding protein [Bacteroidales bacterium]
MKIAITGPESTGKTSLAQNLAKEFKTLCTSEFARNYLDEINRPYEFEDIEIIAKNQRKLEDDLLPKANKILFCDTDMLVTKIWSEFVYGKCSPWITKEFEANRYNLYLLCNIDIEWEYDPQREHPHKRQELFDIYKNTLEAYKFPYIIVNGTGNQRVQNAIKAIQKHYSVVRSL